MRDILAAALAVLLLAWWTRQARMAYTPRHGVALPAVYARNPYRPIRTTRPALAAVVAHGWRHDTLST